MSYLNGQIPLDALQRFDADPDHYSTGPSIARLNTLVRSAQQQYGVTLRVTSGYCAYRPLDAQVQAKKDAIAAGNPGLAAAPGFSTHGGFVNGHDVMAFDIANWQDLAPGNPALARTRFFELVTAAGMVPGVFDAEPWHIIDNNPWVAPAGTEEDMLEQDERDALFAIKSALLDGHPSDLSVSKFDRVVNGVIDVQNRIYVTNDKGERVWDAFQELIPNVRALLLSMGKLSSATPAPVDVAALAAALSEGLGKEIAATLGQALVKGASGS